LLYCIAFIGSSFGRRIDFAVARWLPLSLLRVYFHLGASVPETPCQPLGPTPNTAPCPRVELPLKTKFHLLVLFRRSRPTVPYWRKYKSFFLIPNTAWSFRSFHRFGKTPTFLRRCSVALSPPTPSSQAIFMFVPTLPNRAAPPFFPMHRFGPPLRVDRPRRLPLTVPPHFALAPPVRFVSRVQTPSPPGWVPPQA